MASPWCRPVFCPWTLNLPIAIVLLRLRVHYSVEIKCYKSQIRIRIWVTKIVGCKTTGSFGFLPVLLHFCLPADTVPLKGWPVSLGFGSCLLQLVTWISLV